MNTEIRLATRFALDHPSDAGRLMDRLSAAAANALLAELPAEAAASVLARMSPGHAARCLHAMEPETAARIAASAPAEEVAGILRRIAPARRETILSALPEKLARPLRRVLNQPKSTAGSAADPSPITIPDDFDVAQAREELAHHRTKAPRYVYIVDRRRRLKRVAALSALITAAPDSPVTDLPRLHLPRIGAAAPLASLSAHPGWDSFDELPVIDRSDILVGALHHRTLRTTDGSRLEAGSTADAVSTVLGIGELLWLGMYGLVDSVVSAKIPPAPGTGTTRRNHHG